jgi:ACS family hexuronate transporter-like MFS transporter
MTRRIMGLRWWMISLLMLGAIINYLTRSTLGVAGTNAPGVFNIPRPSAAQVREAVA